MLDLAKGSNATASMHPSSSKGVGSAGAYPANFETCRPVVDIADQAIRRRLKRSDAFSAWNDAPALRFMTSSKPPETMTTACGFYPFSDRT